MRPTKRRLTTVVIERVRNESDAASESSCNIIGGIV